MKENFVLKIERRRKKEGLQSLENGENFPTRDGLAWWTYSQGIPSL